MKVDAGYQRELFVAQLAAVPFLRESVIVRPSFKDGRYLREVCDVMIAFPTALILIQVKATPPEKGLGRSLDQLKQWTLKQVTKWARQAAGAARTVSSDAIRSVWTAQNHLIRITPSMKSRICSIVVCDCPNYVYQGIPQHTERAGSSPIVCFSTDEFSSLCTMYNTAAEFSAYVLMRAAMRGRVAFVGGGEQDLMATSCRAHGHIESARLWGQAITINGGSWRHASTHYFPYRDRWLRNSFMIDDLVSRLANSLASPLFDISSHSRRTPHSISYSDVTRLLTEELSRLTRMDRYAVAERLLLYSDRRIFRGHTHFVVQPYSGMPIVLSMCEGGPMHRLHRLHNCSVAAMLKWGYLSVIGLDVVVHNGLIHRWRGCVLSSDSVKNIKSRVALREPSAWAEEHRLLLPPDELCHSLPLASNSLAPYQVGSLFSPHDRMFSPGQFLFIPTNHARRYADLLCLHHDETCAALGVDQICIAVDSHSALHDEPWWVAVLRQYLARRANEAEDAMPTSVTPAGHNTLPAAVAP